MICSLKCSETENLFASMNVRRFQQIERVARRKLLQIHAVTRL
jgi:proteic killer suppression protein